MNSQKTAKDRKNGGKKGGIEEPLLSQDPLAQGLHPSDNSHTLGFNPSGMNYHDPMDSNTLMINAEGGAIAENYQQPGSGIGENMNNLPPSHQNDQQQQEFSSGTQVNSVNQSFGQFSIGDQSHRSMQEPPSQQFKMGAGFTADPRVQGGGGKFNVALFMNKQRNESVESEETSQEFKQPTIKPNRIFTVDNPNFYANQATMSQNNGLNVDPNEEFKQATQQQNFVQSQKKRSWEQFNSKYQKPVSSQQQQQHYYTPGRSDWRDHDELDDTAISRQGGVASHQRNSDGTVTVSRSQLSSVFKSKLDIYNILTKEGQFYLPPIAECPMVFIKDLMSGKKKMFKNRDLQIIDVPYFDELSGRKIFDEIRYNVKFTQYLPDLERQQRPLNRKYLFNVSMPDLNSLQIINTVDPTFFPTNIHFGYQQRKDRHADKTNQKTIFQNEVFELVMGSNQVVHNRGRALAYLGNADKKRRRPQEFDGGGNDVDMGQKLPRHQYKRRIELANDNQDLFNLSNLQSAQATQIPATMNSMTFANNSNNQNLFTYGPGASAAPQQQQQELQFPPQNQNQ